MKDGDRRWCNRDALLWKEEERMLAVGALIVSELRKSIADELGFTCSAGIAHNKLMAKFGSSMHKPVIQNEIINTFISQCWPR
jgi:DNA polymerase eta